MPPTPPENGDAGARPGAEALLHGRYRLTSKLGSGGMADVFLAEDVRLGRHVAVKILRAPFAEDAEFVERFAAVPYFEVDAGLLGQPARAGGGDGLAARDLVSRDHSHLVQMTIHREMGSPPWARMTMLPSPGR